jgi:hypothetical protein
MDNDHCPLTHINLCISNMPIDVKRLAQIVVSVEQKTKENYKQALEFCIQEIVLQDEFLSKPENLSVAADEVIVSMAEICQLLKLKEYCDSSI